jgi:crotonobetainyl-CoA:carnitine CoA-transferase CaiB-like acyl-CoA transferase
MTHETTLLSPYRVLDFCDVRGALCGTILASMGAEVICIEPPEGNPIRSIPPYYKDRPGPEQSLVWWALGRGKKSVTLDLESTAGRDKFLKLLEKTDFVVESFDPGYMDRLGLGYADLRKIKPSIIFISITAYGQTGPHAGWAASDINVQGMGGHMYLSGDIDRAPVRVGMPAAYWHGGAEGAAGAMIAHHHRRRTGDGQHVDISMQECVMWTLLNTTMTWQMVSRQEMRGGAIRKERGNTSFTRVIWPCKDGVVQAAPIGGGGGTARVRAFKALVEWMRTEGFYDDCLVAKDWNDKDMQNFTQEEYDAAANQVIAFLKTKTMEELYAKSVSDRLLIAPIASVADLLASPQLEDRKFFVDVDYPAIGQSFKHPGGFARFSGTSLIVDRRAPMLGEHNDEAVAALAVGVEASVLENQQ